MILCREILPPAWPRAGAVSLALIVFEALPGGKIGILLAGSMAARHAPVALVAGALWS